MAYDPEKRRAEYLRNKAHINARSAAYRAAHKAEEKAARRDHYVRNKDHVATVSAAYRVENLSIYAEATNWLRARRKTAIPSWADRDKIKKIYAEAARLTATTGTPHEVDHVVPMTSKLVCGLHCEANLEITTASENRTKSRYRWPDMP